MCAITPRSRILLRSGLLPAAMTITPSEPASGGRQSPVQPDTGGLTSPARHSNGQGDKETGNGRARLLFPCPLGSLSGSRSPREMRERLVRLGHLDGVL